jgi:hypothetical protein
MEPVMTQRSFLSFLVFSLLFSVITSCHPIPACQEGKRPQLDCASSEIDFQGQNVSGGANVGFGALSVGGQLQTEDKALREIDTATSQYVVEWRRLCQEYNACVLDAGTYSVRSENLRRRVAGIPEIKETIVAAGADPVARAKALSAAYTALVPEESRTELGLEFTAFVQKPGEPALRPASQGELLVTDTRVAFAVSTSKPAYVYLFQRDPKGGINVLFPDARIPISNPIPAQTQVRIPAGDATYRLNAKDIGTERVFIVASLTPVASMQEAVDKLNSGGGETTALKSMTGVETKAAGPSCRTRALELDDPASASCVRSRGLELDDADSAAPTKASLSARTEAADSTIVQVFAFEHAAK